MIRTTGKNWLEFLTASLCLLAVTAHAVSAGQREPVWMFDHKDTFLDIACLSGQKVVIVGDRGRVLVTHGTYENLWSPRDSGTSEMLTTVSFVDAEHGWAAGHGGVIIHTEDGGESWAIQREPSPQNLPLFDIQFLSRDVGYASGAYDTLLKTTDGGQTWLHLATSSDNIYNGLFFVDESNGFVLGEFGALLKNCTIENASAMASSSRPSFSPIRRSPVSNRTRYAASS